VEEISKNGKQYLTPDEQERLRQKDAVDAHRDGLRADVMGSIVGSDPSSPGYLGKINHLVTAHGAVDALQPQRMGPAGFDVRTMTPARTNESAPSEAAPDGAAGAPALMASGNRMTPATPTALPPEGRADMAAPVMGAPEKRGWLGKIGEGFARMGKIAGRVGDVAGTMLAPEAMLMIPGTTLNRTMGQRRDLMRQEKQLDIDERKQRLEAGASQAQFNTPEKRRAFVQQNPDLFVGADQFQKNDFIATGKWPTREPAAQKETDKKVDSYTNAEGKRVEVFQRADGSTYESAGGKVQDKARITTPFEAFTYGTPEERKSAQEFIDLEKRLGARYQKPSEFDERYRLFKEDPETYKAMFGDRQGAVDKATATKMLGYFDKRRRELDQDFTLDDQQKKEQLADIDRLAQPFMDVTQPGAGGGPKEDRVRVIAPNGQPGTIPRSKLEAAKKKGYRATQ